MFLKRDDKDEEDNDLQQPPEDIWPLLTDVHCHPTDDARIWGDIQDFSETLDKLKVGRICAMSTSIRDQQYVSQLAERLPQKVIPCFGYHPWFVHTISLNEYKDAKEHYRYLFQSEKKSIEIEELLLGIPSPIPLKEILSTLRSNLENHPKALLGEVGIDKAFRLPADPKGWTREPKSVESNGHTHALALQNRPFTSLSTPMEHQLYIIKEQIAIAIDLGRSVSLHSVRAGGATMLLLDDLRKAYPSPEEGMNKRERKQYKYAQRRETIVDNEKNKDNKCFGNINIDLHSCTLSASLINQIQRKHSNVYISFSTAINSRQKGLYDQLRACDPKRLLIESDYHFAEEIGVRCWQMLRLATDVLGDQLLKDQYPSEEKYLRAARIFDDNWNRFIHPSISVA